MITVLLYGHLAKRYGKRHRLNIATPAEAVRAFCANYSDFKQQIMLDGQAAYRVLVGKEDRADEQGLHLPASQTIKIVPVVSGSGSFGKILAGAALIGLSTFLPTGFSAFGGIFSKFSLASTVSSFGVSMILGGVSGLLFGTPKADAIASERPNNKPSFNFNGPVNTSGQGNAVPVLYGKLWIGGQIISAGTVAEDL